VTELLSITAHPDAPLACDMTGAGDTLANGVAEYRRLFEHARLGRESTDTVTTFRFADRPGVREWLLDLVRREAACCPFLSYEIHPEGSADSQEIVWTTGGGVGASEMAVLDGFRAGPAQPLGDSASIARRLEEGCGVPVIVPAERG
jgi:hypothetical protein